MGSEAGDPGATQYVRAPSEIEPPAFETQFAHTLPAQSSQEGPRACQEHGPMELHIQSDLHVRPLAVSDMA